jgi:transcriptional regulator with XRE-family HTH domain
MARNWRDEPPEDWAENQAQHIGQKIREARELNKVSAQQLADATTKIGLPVSRVTIADIENGRRRYVSTAELIAISSAMGISPFDLLYPSGEEVEYLPDSRLPRFVAQSQFAGLRGPDIDQASRLIGEARAAAERILAVTATSEILANMPDTPWPLIGSIVERGRERQREQNREP